MHIEKAIFYLVIGFTVYICFMMAGLSYKTDTVSESPVSQGIRITPDFDISAVLDNTPFTDYYSSGKRNPFIPYQDRKFADIPDNPDNINTIDTTFTFPDDGSISDTVDIPDADTIDIPDKPGTDDDPEKVDTDIVKQDESIPVYLIGFVKTESKQDKNRKAILSHKTTGRVYTVQRGNILLGLSILKVTPYSVTMELGSGRKIEYCYDLLKPGTEPMKI